MTKREGYSTRMERKLAGWKKQFETQRAAAGAAGSAIKAEVREKLEAAKVAGDAAFAKLQELRQAAVRWGAIRDEMEKLWLEIEGTLGAPAPDPEAPSEPRRRASNA